MSKTAVFTIVAKNYLAHARTLMESVARVSPNVQQFVFLADEPEGHFTPEDEPFTIISSQTLPIEAIRWFHFKYTVIELSTAIKPYAAQALFDEHDVDRLVYLDPDIFVYSSLDAIFAELDDADILLTPHLTEPLYDGRRPDEQDILRSGAYNLGFIALRRSESAETMLKWWQTRLYELCVVSPDQGLFVDQRWIDLVPGLVPNVKVVRDPGWNVAYWNVHGRRVDLSDGTPTVNGRPLVFFHFSGLDAHTPEHFSKHQDRFQTSDLGDAAVLVRRYADNVIRNGFHECREWGYSWARFRDGSTVPDIARPVHHEEPSILTAIDDPFSEAGRDAFAEVWNRPDGNTNGTAATVTRIARRVYSARPDVQRAMPDILGADSARFLEWFVTSGQDEHRLPDMLVAPIRSVVEQSPSGAAEKTDSNWPPLTAPEVADLAPLLSGAPGVRQALAAHLPAEASAEERRQAAEDYLAADTHPAGATAARPRVAQLILDSRPDVRRRCIHGDLLDEAWYVAWLSTYGKVEYRFPPTLAAAVAKYRDAFLSSSDGFGALRSRLYSLFFSITARRSGAAATPAAPERGPGQSPSRPAYPAHPAARGVPGLQEEALAEKRASRPFGVNLVGYVRAEMGVGESVRLAHSALAASNVPVGIKALSTNGVHSERDERLQEDAAMPYRFDVIHANADVFETAVAQALGPLHDPRHTIGYWAWELSEFPPEMDHAFALCGEIWTPSDFCRQAISLRSPVPVVTVPHPIRTRIEIQHDRAHFGLSSERFIFLCMADLLSVPERKNPLGAIEAFIRASPHMPDAELIVKISNGHHNPSAMEKLRAAVGQQRVRILDTTMPRTEVDSLINAADCFLSLHRSEGFGLPMAEAMSLGKPVVATGYSGNMDFMDRETAFLVDAGNEAVPAGCAPYREGAIWAEPSIEHAAALLETVYRDTARRQAIASNGRRTVLAKLDPRAIGQTMKERLEVISRRLDEV